MHSRRVLLHPSYVEAFRNALRAAKADLAAQHFRHQCAYEDLLAEIADLRAEVSGLRDILSLIAGTLRTQAETDVATLRRQLETALARLERSPATRLH